MPKPSAQPPAAHPKMRSQIRAASSAQAIDASEKRKTQVIYSASRATEIDAGPWPRAWPPRQGDCTAPAGRQFSVFGFDSRAEMDARALRPAIVATMMRKSASIAPPGGNVVHWRLIQPERARGLLAPASVLVAFGRSAAEFGGEVNEIVGDHIEIMLGPEVPRLVRAVFKGAGDKGGVKATAPRRHQVAVVRRHHHALPGLEVEERGAAVVGFRLRLVRVGDLGTEDHVPRQAGMFGHVHHQRDIAVRQRRDDEFALETGEALDRVRPWGEAVPGAVEVVDIRFAKTGDPELLQQLDQILAVKVVELDPRALALTHAVHRRLIARSPPVGEGMPVLVVPPRCEAALRLAGDTVAPIHHCPEYIEGQGLHVGERHRPNSFPRASYPTGFKVTAS